MRDNGAVILRGEVLDVTHRSGVSKASQQPYAFDTVSILTGKSVSEVTWGELDECGPVPKEGDTINIECELGTYAGRLQINALRPARTGVRAAAAS